MPVRPRGFSGLSRNAVPPPLGGMYGFWAVADGPGVPHGDQDGWPGANGARGGADWFAV